MTGPSLPPAPRGFLVFSTAITDVPTYIRATSIDALRVSTRGGTTLYLRGGVTTHVADAFDVIVLAITAEDNRL